MAQTALGHEELALDAAHSNAARDSQAVLQARPMVEHFRVEQLASRQPGFTANLCDRCTLTDHAPPEQLLSGPTRVLERLATTIRFGAFATSAHPNRDQYLA